MANPDDKRLTRSAGMEARLSPSTASVETATASAAKTVSPQEFETEKTQTLDRFEIMMAEFREERKNSNERFANTDERFLKIDEDRKRAHERFERMFAELSGHRARTDQISEQLHTHCDTDEHTEKGIESGKIENRNIAEKGDQRESTGICETESNTVTLEENLNTENLNSKIEQNLNSQSFEFDRENDSECTSELFIEPEPVNSEIVNISSVFSVYRETAIEIIPINSAPIEPPPIQIEINPIEIKYKYENSEKSSTSVNLEIPTQISDITHTAVTNNTVGGDFNLNSIKNELTGIFKIISPPIVNENVLKFHFDASIGSPSPTPLEIVQKEISATNIPSPVQVIKTSNNKTLIQSFTQVRAGEKSLFKNKCRVIAKQRKIAKSRRKLKTIVTHFNCNSNRFKYRRKKHTQQIFTPSPVRALKKLIRREMTVKHEKRVTQ